jgi:ribosomal protein S27AE
MLRSELQSELANVRDFLAEEKRKAAARDGVAVPSQHDQPAPIPRPAPAPTYQARAPLPMSPPAHERPPSSSSMASDSPDQRVCPNCGKTFGKRGFAVHSARCGKHATEDFTYSKDSAHPDHISEKPNNHDPGAPPNGMTQEQWQQFMVTYPRPVIDEQPKTAGQRTAAAAAAAQRREMMMHAGGPGPADEQRVPCGRCGRMFLQSRVRQHEAVCVADPRM